MNKANAVVALSTSANAIFASNPITISATVAAPVGTSSSATPPTGTVSFYDGTNLLGTATISESSAAFTTANLSAGTHSITATYQGDVNYVTATSASLSEVIDNFTVAPPSGGTTSATATAGGQASYSLAFTPPSGQTFPSAINLTVSGLPAGATATFSPPSIPAGAGATTVTLTIQLPKTTAVQVPPAPMNGPSLPISLGLVLLPFAALRRRHVQVIKKNAWMILFAAFVSASMAGLVSCGGHASSGTTGTAPQTYTLVVTATSGSLSNSTSLTLTVQ